MSLYMTAIIVTGCAPSLGSLPCKLHQCDARCAATRQYISDTIRDQHLLASFKSQSAVFLSTLYSTLCLLVFGSMRNKRSHNALS